MEIVRPDENDQKLVQQWNKNCVGCHVSQQENNYQPGDADLFDAVGGFRHVVRAVPRSRERARPGVHAPRSAAAPPVERSIVRPTRLDPKTSSMICAQCHSLRDVIAPGYTAGADYYDYFQPVLEYGPQKAQDPAYWPDGRPRRFSNDAIGLWQSECFLRGGATCTSCHRDPHVPDVDRNAQLASTSNALCTGCHQDIGAPVDGAHAPSRRQRRQFVRRVPHAEDGDEHQVDDARSHDRPAGAGEHGRVRHPQRLHRVPRGQEARRGRSTRVEKWWPQGRRLKHVARAEAFTAARAGRPEALDRLIAIAADDRQGPLIQANAAGYLGTYKDPRAAAALLGAAKADHPAIRSVARSRAWDTRRGRRLPPQRGHPRRTGRPASRGAHLGAGVADQPRRRTARLRRMQRVSGGWVREFAARARLHQDDARHPARPRVDRLLTGEFDLAAAALQISVGLEPDRASAKFFLALARLGQRRVDEARALLKQVPASDPFYRQAQERLKQLEPPR